MDATALQIGDGENSSRQPHVPKSCACDRRNVWLGHEFVDEALRRFSLKP